MLKWKIFEKKEELKLKKINKWIWKFISRMAAAFKILSQEFQSFVISLSVEFIFWKKWMLKLYFHLSPNFVHVNCRNICVFLDKSNEK